jgi:capsular polysaccharide transport system permease protein
LCIGRRAQRRETGAPPILVRAQLQRHHGFVIREVVEPPRLEQRRRREARIRQHHNHIAAAVEQRHIGSAGSPARVPVPCASTNARSSARTGLLPYQLYSRIASALTNAFDANEALLAYPIVKPVDTLIARALLEIATAALVMILLFGGLVYFIDVSAPEALHVMVAAILGLSLMGFGVGTINAVISKVFVSWRQVYDVASRPLMLVCGVFFTLDTLPPGAREVVSYIPIAHGIELFRSGFYAGYRSTTMDIGYLFVCGLVLCLIGLAAERIIRLTRP